MAARMDILDIYDIFSGSPLPPSRYGGDVLSPFLPFQPFTETVHPIPPLMVVFGLWVCNGVGLGLSGGKNRVQI